MRCCCLLGESCKHILRTRKEEEEEDEEEEREREEQEQEQEQAGIAAGLCGVSDLAAVLLVVRQIVHLRADRHDMRDGLTGHTIRGD